ncbi:hypothetical protein LJR030_000733 [Rhizobium sp. LjRoot30]|uniref:hypothetical protein n=1 Tax=Rhizobium sp. LjRoot30 TaxID=3342320 RepID=UPI003ED0F337
MPQWGTIQLLIDQTPFIHSLRPMDMMRHGWLTPGIAAMIDDERRNVGLMHRRRRGMAQGMEIEVLAINADGLPVVSEPLGKAVTELVVRSARVQGRKHRLQAF